MGGVNQPFKREWSQAALVFRVRKPKWHLIQGNHSRHWHKNELGFAGRLQTCSAIPWLVSSNAATPHHLHELLEIDLSVAVLVNFCHDLCNILGRRTLNSIVIEHMLNLSLVNLSITITIKDTECLPAHILGHVDFLVERCGK